MNEEQLEAMSDLQLDNHISAAMWKARCLKLKQWNNSAQRSYEECKKGLFVHKAKDYCNSYNDMMPLVVEAGIELSPLFCGEWAASELNNYTYEEDPIYNGYQACHKNPLRAAAIVYLLMGSM